MYIQKYWAELKALNMADEFNEQILVWESEAKIHNKFVGDFFYSMKENTKELMCTLCDNLKIALMIKSVIPGAAGNCPEVKAEQG